MQRTRLSIIALLASIWTTLPAHGDDGAPGEALSAEDIVARSVQARGGLEAWKSVRTVRMQGAMELEGGESAPLTLEFKRPSKVRIEFEIQGRKGSQAYDGETAWAVVSFGEGEPVRLDPEQSQELVQQADFEGPLVGYREKGHEIRLVGPQTLEGTDVYSIELERKDGEVTVHHIDAESFLEVRQSTRRSIEEREVEISVRLSDYRKVGELLIPHRVEQSVSVAPAPQVIQLDSVELNVDLADERFAFPEDPG